MNTVLLILLIIYTEIITKTVINEDKQFLKLSIPKELKIDNDKNMIILSKWNIPKNNNTTISNFLTEIDIIICHLEQDKISKLVEMLTFENTMKELNKSGVYLKETELNEIFGDIKKKCFKNSSKNKFNSISVVIEDTSETAHGKGSKTSTKKYEIAPIVKENTEHLEPIHISFKLYSNTWIFNKITKLIEKTRGVNDTTDSQNQWENILEPRFIIEQKREDLNTAVIFKDIELVKDDMKFDEYTSDDKSNNKIKELYGYVEKGLSSYLSYLPGIFLSREKIDVLIILDSVDDDYKEFKRNNKEISLIEYFKKNSGNEIVLNINDKTTLKFHMTEYKKNSNIETLELCGIKQFIDDSNKKAVSLKRKKYEEEDEETEEEKKVEQEDDEEEEKEEEQEEDEDEEETDKVGTLHASGEEKQKNITGESTIVTNENEDNNNDNEDSKGTAKHKFIWLVISVILIVISLVAIGLVMRKKTIRNRKNIERGRRKEVGQLNTNLDL